VRVYVRAVYRSLPVSISAVTRASHVALTGVRCTLPPRRLPTTADIETDGDIDGTTVPTTGDTRVDTEVHYSSDRY
jgi:hypothetical protein